MSKFSEAFGSNVRDYNPTPQNIRNLQTGSIDPFLQALFANPGNAGAYINAMGTNPVQLTANNAIGSAINGGAQVSPWESSAFMQGNPAILSLLGGGSGTNALGLGSPTLMGLLGGGAALGALGQADPTRGALAQGGGTINALLGGGRGGGMNFSNQFSELANPYGLTGGINPALQTIAAAAPGFEEQRQRALTDLTNAAPNRFSGAFVQEGNDLARRSLQDYNAFAAQALQEGINQQLQSQQMDLNFLLGARQLQQGATNDVNQANLSAAGLTNQAQIGGLGALGTLAQNASGANAALLGLINQAQLGGLGALGDLSNLQQSGTLGGLSALGALSQNAGNAYNAGQQNYLQLLSNAGQLGLGYQNAYTNPIMQLILGAMGYANPQGNQAVVSPGFGSQYLQLLGAIAGGAAGR